MSSILEKEIFEQPDAIQKLLDEEIQPVTKMAAELRDTFNYILIAARGTSDNAARYTQYLFGAYNRLPVVLATPSLFTLYQSPPLLRGAFVVGISQSGQSPDIVSVVTEGHNQGRPTLAITNDVHSPLAKAADYVIPLHAGVENAVAATKTYTTSLAAMALLSCTLAGDKERLTLLQDAPKMMRQTLENIKPSLEHIERYCFMQQCAVIGRGFNYATAFEVALKVKELTGIVTVPYSSADFRHGPIAMVHAGVPVLLIIPTGSVMDDMYSLFQQLQKMEAETIVISDIEKINQQANLAFTLPAKVPEWITPLITVIPGQLFGMILARERGLNVDQPKGLTKVTETF